MSCEIQPATGGFSFTNVARNAFLAEKGYAAPKTVKTGTTIVGIIVKDGVVLGADTRATSGDIVADKNSEKIHRLARKIYCCGAGTAADTEMTTRSMESQLELLRLNTDREVRVASANRLLKQFLFRYQGHIGAALIVGGVDVDGSHLYSIYPHGSTDKLPYTTMGSGSLAAMAVLESRWRPDMSIPDGMKIVRDAIHAGIMNDLGSGSSVDIYVISKSEPDVQMHRPYEEVGVRGQREGDYTFPRGTTAVLKTEYIPIEIESEEIVRMDTDES